MYDKRRNQLLSEREFVEMIIKSFEAGHTLLKQKIKNSPHHVENLEKKINYLKTSQKNKFKKIVEQEYKKYLSGMEVSLIIS